MLLQEGVNLISTCRQSKVAAVIESKVADITQGRWEQILVPCSGRDSAMTNLQSGSFLFKDGRVMPALLHFQYSIAVRRRPIPS